MYKYFADVTTAEEAKARYRELCRTYHPDISKRPDANATMAAINSEWEKVWERLKDTHQTADGKTYTETRNEYKAAETAGEFAEIIGKLVTLTDVTVELVGSWIWVTGNTYIHRDTLKGLGFGWAGKKHAWYYHKGDYHKGGKKEIPLDDIRAKYGAIRYEQLAQLKLA